MVRFVLFSIALLPVSHLAALGQNAPSALPAQSQSAGPATPSGVDRRITLEVEVTDNSGAAVRGLQKEDFSVLDGKQLQNIVSFLAMDRAAASSAAVPVEILAVVDAINASVNTVSYERNELRKFLLQNDGKLPQPVTLVFFSGAGKIMVSDRSRDGKALAALSDKYELGPPSSNLSAAGFHAAADRFDLSVKTLTSLVTAQAKRSGRKLMVWISPGWPMLSGNLQLSAKDYHRLFDSIVALSTDLREAHITLYDVDPLGVSNAGGTRITHYQEFLKGVALVSHVEPGDLGLQVLAIQSGGRVLNSSNELRREMEDCAADADAFYVLSFNAPRADRPNEYHSLEVMVDKPGTKARTRTGYYAQP